MNSKATPNSPLATAARASLAGQAFNVGKGFDKTKIESLDSATIQNIVTQNDLSVLTPKQQTEYIKLLCESLGLNPLTQPIKLVLFDDKSATDKKKTLRPYVSRDGTDQLRKIYGVSVVKLEKQMIDDIFFVTAYVEDHTGRTDVATGAVSMNGVTAAGSIYALTGQNKANAMMKAETKAKRRATLSICGLGFLDESEVEAVPGAPSVLPDTDEPNGVAEPAQPVSPLNNDEGLGYVQDLIASATSTDDLTQIYESNVIEVFSDDMQQILIGKLNDRYTALQATEDTEAQTGADVLAKVKDLIEAAKTRQELEKILADWVEQFKPEAIKQKFKDMLNACREQIRRETVNTDANTAAQTQTKGLFKKK